MLHITYDCYTHLLQVAITKCVHHPNFKTSIFQTYIYTLRKTSSYAEAMEAFDNPILPRCVVSFLQIKRKKQTNIPNVGADYAKRFKSNMMINRATSGSESNVHISEQIVAFMAPAISTINQLFHDFYRCNVSKQQDDNWQDVLDF